jgi:hypothetical protein
MKSSVGGYNYAAYGRGNQMKGESGKIIAGLFDQSPPVLTISRRFRLNIDRRQLVEARQINEIQCWTLRLHPIWTR